MAKQRFLKKHRSPPKIKPAHVYETREAAMRYRDLRASEQVGLDVIVQCVFDTKRNAPGYIVREVQYEAPKPTEVDHSMPKPRSPAFKNHAERSEYMRELADTEQYRRAMAERVYPGRSKEPKSIHAEVPVRSIARPKAKSKRQEHEDYAAVRYGRYAPAQIARGWHKLPRTE